MLSFRPPVLRSCHRWTAREGLARNKRSVSRHVLRYLANVGAVDMSLFPSSLGEMERKKKLLESSHQRESRAFRNTQCAPCPRVYVCGGCPYGMN